MDASVKEALRALRAASMSERLDLSGAAGAGDGLGRGGWVVGSGGMCFFCGCFVALFLVGGGVVACAVGFLNRECPGDVRNVAHGEDELTGNSLLNVVYP